MKNMKNKYKIARQVEIEDMCNAMGCIGVDVNSINEQTKGAIYDSLFNKLAEDSIYNECYNSALFEVLKEFNVKCD